MIGNIKRFRPKTRVMSKTRQDIGGTKRRSYGLGHTEHGSDKFRQNDFTSCFPNFQ